MPFARPFSTPCSEKSSREGFHAMWPTCIVQQLRKQWRRVTSKRATTFGSRDL